MRSSSAELTISTLRERQDSDGLERPVQRDDILKAIALQRQCPGGGPCQAFDTQIAVAPDDGKQLPGAQQLTTHSPLPR